MMASDAAGSMARHASRIRERFAWSAGGLDLNIEDLCDLRPSAAPPLVEPTQVRGALEKLGYLVRRKMPHMDSQPRNGASSAAGLVKKRVAKKKGRGSQPGRAKWVVLRRGELLQLYNQHRDGVLAANARLAVEQSARGLQPDAVEVGVFWWHDEGDAGELSDNNLMGLRTALHIGGLEVHLYAYEKPSNLPEGVQWQDARAIMPLEEYWSIRERGWKPANVGDLGRMRAIAEKMKAGKTFVWFGDLDTQWVQSVKTACSQLPAAAFQHVVATLQGVRGSRAGCARAAKKGMLGFLHTPMDHEFPMTPVRFTSRSPLVKALLGDLEVALHWSPLLGSQPDYQVFMEALCKRVREFGLLGAYVDTDKFCGVPAFTRRRCLKNAVLTMDGSQPVTVESLLETAIGVNTFWQSGKYSEDLLVARGAHRQVEQGSLWEQLMFALLEKIDLSHLAQEAHGSQPAGARGLQPSMRITQKSADPRADVAHPLPWSELEPAEDSRAASFSPTMDAVSAGEAWARNDIRKNCQLIRQLGAGTYGTVYAGKYRQSARLVAVKIEKSERLHKPVSSAEVMMLLRVQGHPNITTLVDYFVSSLFNVIVQEFLDADLGKVLQQHTPRGGLQPAVALHVAQELAKGVAHMHECGVLHRDLHLGNVLAKLIGSQPAQEIEVRHFAAICVCDLGQACDMHGDQANCLRSANMGAACIRPPECFLARKGSCQMYDRALDVWAIGVNFMCLIKGFTFVPKFKDTREFVKFFSSIIGKVDLIVAKRWRWEVDASYNAFGACQNGLQPVAGGEEVKHHLRILQWNPCSRPTASSLTQPSKRECLVIELPPRSRPKCG